MASSDEDDFFGTPPKPPEPTPPAQEPPVTTWLDDVAAQRERCERDLRYAPQPVLESFVLARSKAAAILVEHINAYPNGFQLDAVARWRVPQEPHEVWDPMYGLTGMRLRPGQRHDDLHDDYLRFGLAFADGRKVTNLGWPGFASLADNPAGPLLLHEGGHCDQWSAAETFWVWPLPPAGALTFVCMWPLHSIELTRVQIDAQPILDAAARSRPLWK